MDGWTDTATLSRRLLPPSAYYRCPTHLDAQHHGRQRVVAGADGAAVDLGDVVVHQRGRPLDHAGDGLRCIT